MIKHKNNPTDRPSFKRAGLILSIFLVIALFNGCKKFVEVDSPLTSITGQNAFKDDATAAAVLTGIYTNMSFKSFIGVGGGPTLSFYVGLSADEFVLNSEAVNNTEMNQYYTNSLSSNSTPNYWGGLYNIIYSANSAVEGLTSSNTLTNSVKNQLLGEAKFIRAFCYFYLVNFYGDVPLILTSDYTKNAVMPRSATKQVYLQIIDDLIAAQQTLNINYFEGNGLSSDPNTLRLRPNRGAATALLARVYLFNNDYLNADIQSTAVINTPLYKLSGIHLDDVFLNTSKEAIWQLQSVQASWNTKDAKLFIIPETGPSGEFPIYLREELLNDFEVGDQRKQKWISSINASGTDYFFPYKYKSATLDAPVTEFEMVLRLGEQYLIRAESRARLGNISGAQSDLNVIRTRAGLSNTEASTPNTLVDAILKERRVELFSEWGHRWLDIKRTNRIDEIMAPVTHDKGGNWNPFWSFYPIPFSEIQSNPSLKGNQNPGYLY